MAHGCPSEQVSVYWQTPLAECSASRDGVDVAERRCWESICWFKGPYTHEARRHGMTPGPRVKETPGLTLVSTR